MERKNQFAFGYFKQQFYHVYKTRLPVRMSNKF